METTIQRGGKRLGAGRKKGLASIKAEEVRKYLSKTVAAEFEFILRAQIEAAKGIYYEETDDEGVKRIYQKLPDGKAAQYLINQTIGRPKESIDLELKEPFSLVALAAKRAVLSKESEVK